ncbi:MAG: type II toxin-antitoxin system RelE/ParE family toxin [Verrucomicrobiota bacterium]
MSWQVSIRKEAQVDLLRAREWYDQIDRELGDRFLDEVSVAMQELAQDPLIPSLYYRDFRRILLKKFPYKVFYQVIDQRVIVFRVLHAHECHESRLD